MTVHVALVRAVMQGREGLTGDVLRAATLAAGAAAVRTYHATGNVLFVATDGAAVCAALGEAVSDVVGRPTPVLHRTVGHLQALLDADLFADVDATDERLVVHVGGEVTDEQARAVPAGATFLGRVGPDLAYARHTTSGGHPMPALEASTGLAMTTRGVRTVAGIVRVAASLRPGSAP